MRFWFVVRKGAEEYLCKRSPEGWICGACGRGLLGRSPKPGHCPTVTCKAILVGFRDLDRVSRETLDDGDDAPGEEPDHSGRPLFRDGGP